MMVFSSILEYGAEKKSYDQDPISLKKKAAP